MAVENWSNYDNLVQQFNSSLQDDKLREIIFCLCMITSNDRNKTVIIGKHLNINKLFDVIQNQSKTSFSVTTLALPADNLLRNLLEVIHPQEIICSYIEYIEKSFLINNEHLQQICLYQIYRLAEVDTDRSFFLSHPNLFIISFHYLNSEFINVACLARNILNILFKSKNIKPEWMFSDEIQNVCKSLFISGAIKRFRVYEVFFDFLLIYADYLSNCTYILDNLINEIVDKKDILCQLNGLEMLLHPAFLNENGIKYLYSKGIYDWILTFDCSNDSLQDTLLPGIVKLVGNICAEFPIENKSKYEKLVGIIFKHFENSNSSLRCLCAETLSFIWSCSNGRNLLVNSNLDRLKSVMKQFFLLIKHENEHIQIRVLAALINIFNQDLMNPEISLVCQTLYKCLDQNVILFLFNIVKQPFLDIRYKVLNLMLILLKFDWFEQDVIFCPGFMEYLLNRKTDRENEGKQLKYNIVKKLISSTATKNIGTVFHERLLRYDKEGPFFNDENVIVSYDFIS
ncbi:26S proteasome non-ATPase regulatory subunit 5 [Hydra vulgaris]|uniref:26S proteasome non-ATPase regulatory subunit 5 n=1 Tax=Hydra vulgaris TaxID=6087 RepID=UPI001F5FDCBC|nr:26S proteasome non-ATPase regulatory subunit 5 [Hydra vulgaris]